MPALKPATIGQKLLTDFGQNRPLTTLGYDDAVIRRHESGRGNAKADTLQKYAEALNVNPESLLCAD